MTVYYLVTELADNKGFSRYEGIYKIRGRWYNILIDIAYDMGNEIRKEKGYTEKIFTFENMCEETCKTYGIKILSEMNEQGLKGVHNFFRDLIGLGKVSMDDGFECGFHFEYGILRGLVPMYIWLRYHYDEDIYSLEFLVDIEDRIKNIVLRRMIYDPSLHMFFTFLGGRESLSQEKLEIYRLEDLRRFKTLKNLHNKLLETIE